MSAPAPGDQCPGCGAPAAIRAQLAADRAEMSDRLAASTCRANDAIEVLRTTPTRVDLAIAILSGQQP